MRRFLCTAVLLACAALAAAGCGGDDSSGGALESALPYVPADTPFAVAIDTDIDGDQYQSLDAIVGKFPGGDVIKESLLRQLEEGRDGVSFEDDVRPLLGNPFVVSATDATSFLSDSEDSDFVGAIQVEDTDALDALIDKTKADERGEVAGATVYEDDGTLFAVEDDMVVFGGSEDQLEAALERADGDDHLELDAFQQSLEGLPAQALARLYVDIQALIEQDRGGAAAGRIEWVGALRTMGLTASVQDDAVDVDFNLRTDGSLGDDDLPLAAGDEAPEVVQRDGEIGFGIRDPRQVVTFFESALQATDPQGFGEYETGKRALAQRLDLDVEKDVFDQLTGDTSVSVAVDGSFGARAEIESPDAFGETVDKVAEALPQLGSGLGVTDVRRRGDLYEVHGTGARFVFGLSDGALVVASDAARARGLGTERPEAVDGASGSFVMTADAEQVAGQVLQQLGPQLGMGGALGGGLFARPLDDLRGSVSSSTEGLKGSFSLTLD